MPSPSETGDDTDTHGAAGTSGDGSGPAAAGAPAPHRPSGPTAVAARSLAPDLARGAMLLFIALANSHSFLHPPWAEHTFRAMPIGGSTLDSTVGALLITLVDGRSYTMFAALFGYGMVQIMRRQEGAGLTQPETRVLLRRRGWWLVAIGFLHATLLFVGDILAAYGLLAVLLVGTLRLPDRKLAIRATAWILLGSLAYGLISLPAETMTDDPTMGDNPLLSAGMRAGSVLVLAPMFAITAAGAFLLGGWAARRRVLEEPERHLPLLRRTAVLGIAVSTMGGLPLGLVVTGALPPASGLVFGLGFLHALTGYAGGLGYAALIALVAARIGQRHGPIVTALAATGQRSMTCYLTQSVAWQLAFAPYFFGLADEQGPAVAALLAICVWAMTVVLADVLRRTGNRGPFEVLMRRLTYGSRALRGFG